VIDRDLESICLKCLEKRSDHRYLTARALSEDLTRFLNNEQVLVRPIGALGRMWRWYHRTPTAPTVTAGGLTMFIAILLTIWGAMGIVIYAVGKIPSPQPLWPIAQLCFFLICFYVPMIWAATRTLNGSVFGLWICTFFTALLFSIAVGIMTNLPFGISTWEVMELAHSSQHVRLQFGSLLAVIGGVAMFVDILAILSWWGAVRRAEINASQLSAATVNGRKGRTRKTDTVEGGD
jgi:hypothetical protein